MKFRTRIWIMPAVTAAALSVGLLASWIAGGRTAEGLRVLRTVDVPYLAAVTAVDRGVEQFRLTLQTAASEGDIDKLKDVEAIGTETTKSVLSLSTIAGKAGGADSLGKAVDAYQTAALEATQRLLSKGDFAEQVRLMQESQSKLQKLLEARKVEAAQSVDNRQEAAVQGVQRLLLLYQAFGLLALVLLGCASWLTVRAVWRDLGSEPEALRAATRRVADGDLTVSVEVHGADHSLAGAVAQMVDRLRNAVGTIRQSTDSIATASSEIASGNMDLSTRTEQTASDLQQTASSIGQLTSNVRLSADSAAQANQLANTAALAAQRGGQIVAHVVTNMDHISAASLQIGEIIGTIDGIAFQTNILALNAAVEAARAGEQGRGFAVVAGAVRALAQRTALAAREIKTLVVTSGEKVQSGSQLVKNAGLAMDDIVAGVKRVSDIIGEISAGTKEQSVGIGEVNASVVRLDEMTQQNSALVEQSAAAAESLREQSTRLAESVSAFRLA